jgi:hypothetical protein
MKKTETKICFLNIGIFLIYIFYITASIITFMIINRKYPLDGEEVKKWIFNYNHYCHEFDFTYGLQNACLNGCAYTTAPFIAYISFINRHKI